MDMFAGTFRRFRGRGGNLISSKCHLGHNIATAAGTKILILCFHGALMLPKSTDVEKKKISTHFARRAVQGVSLGGKHMNGILFLFEYWKIGMPWGFRNNFSYDVIWLL